MPRQAWFSDHDLARVLYGFIVKRTGKGGKGTFVPSVLDGKVEGDHSSRACAGLAD